MQQPNNELNYGIFQLSDTLNKSCLRRKLVVLLFYESTKAEESIAHSTASIIIWEWTVTPFLLCSLFLLGSGVTHNKNVKSDSYLFRKQIYRESTEKNLIIFLSYFNTTWKSKHSILSSEGFPQENPHGTTISWYCTLKTTWDSHHAFIKHRYPKMQQKCKERQILFPFEQFWKKNYLQPNQ